VKKILRSLSAALFLLLPAVAAAETTWVINASVPQVDAAGGYMFYAFKLTSGVWPVAPGHTAGVVYTWDNWQTAQWGTLTWKFNQPNAYGTQDEVWAGRFNVPPYISPIIVIQYAIYVDDANGNRTWNNNNGQNFVVQNY
jgi:hypothetical protein